MQVSFNFFVTNFEKDGQFLKLWGHKDKVSFQNVEKTIQQSFQHFEKGIGVPDPGALRPDLVCCARYTDGAYYRARITHVDWNKGLVFCHFFDYGIGDCVPMADLRLVDSTSPLLRISPQATCFILAGVVGSWDQPSLSYIKPIILYNDLKAVVVQSIGQTNIFRVYLEHDQELGDVLVRAGVATYVRPEAFEVMVWRAIAAPPPQQLPASYTFNAMWSGFQSPAFLNIPPVPAVQPPTVPAPSLGPVDMRAARFPTYPTLDRSSEHKVFISHCQCNNDSLTFYAQLLQDLPELEKLSTALNGGSQFVNLSPPFVPGRICVAKFSEDDQKYRAVITHVTDTVQVYFVDYGNMDTVQASDIYEIPIEFSRLQAMAVPFALAHWNKVKVSNEVPGIVSDIINEQDATLKVSASTELSTKQYCDLFIEETNVIELINVELLKRQPKLAFRNMPVPTAGGRVKVIGAFVKSFDNFYVQLAAHQNDLEAMMATVKTYCNGPAARMQPHDIQPGAPCCALFNADDQWYRAMITNASTDELSVMYVDYGNEERVTIADLRVANEQIVNPLLAQAIPCRLSGFEEFEGNPDQFLSRFEDLIIEQCVIMHVVKLIEEVPCIVVKLFDENGVDIMTKLKSTPIQQINGHTIIPPAHLKVATSASGQREVVVRKDSSSHTRTENVKPNNRHQEQNGTYCPKKDPAAWGIGEKQGALNSISHCDRISSSKYQTKETVSINEQHGASLSPNSVRIADASVQVGTTQEVVVTYVKSLESLCVMPTCFSKDFRDLMKNLQGCYPKEEPVSKPSVGQSVVVRYSDGAFYRAKIAMQRDGKYGVVCVDYGNKYLASPCNIFALEERFSGLPAVALQCHFIGAISKLPSWTTPEIYDLLKGNLQCTFHSLSEKGYGVTCTRGGKSVLPLMETCPPVKAPRPRTQRTLAKGSSHDAIFSYIQSPDEFYVHLQQEADQLEKLQQDLQTAASQMSPVQGMPKNGTQVMAVFDGDWYRGTITANGSIFFHDYGNTESYPDDSNSVRTLPTNLQATPGFALKCQFEHPLNKQWAPNAQEELVKLFEEAESLTLHIKSVQEGSYVVNIPSLTQQLPWALVPVSVPAQQPVSEPCTTAGPRMIKEGSCHEAIFSYIQSPDEFYVHLQQEADQLEKLQQDLQAAAPQASPVQGMPKCGSQLMAVFEGDWYRGTITANGSIFFHDYGSTETYPEDSNNVRGLPSSLQTIPGFALKCRFDHPRNKQWAPNAQEELVKLFEEAESLTLHIKSVQEGSYVVNIPSLTQQLPWALVPVSVPAQQPVSEPCTTAGPRMIKEGSCHKAIFSYIQSPDEFYVHLQQEADQLEKLQQDLQAAAPQVSPVQGMPKCGSQLMAVFEGDWYRGTITANGSIFFHDYGNTETYPEDSNNVRGLPTSLQTIPGFALKCRFDHPHNKQWAPNAQEELVKLFEEAESLTLLIKSVQQGSYVVDIPTLAHQLPWTEVAVSVPVNVPVNVPVSVPVQQPVQQPVSEPCTTGRPRTIEEGSSHGSIFSYIQSPDEFYVHLQEEEVDLEKLQRTLETTASQMSPVQGMPEPGTQVVAVFEGDWYRGTITANGSIFFHDYGNTETYPEDSNNVRVLPSNLQTIPAFALKCRFDRPLNKQWAPNAQEELVKLFEEADCLTLLVKSVQEGSYVVDIKNISGQLEKYFIDKGGVGATIVNLTSPDDFYMHLEDDAPKMTRVAQQLVDAALFKTSECWSPGDSCAALFDEDNLWYRATIVSSDPPYHVVRFVDYGNESRTDAVRILPDDLQSIPPLAFHCAIPRIQNLSWVDEAKGKLEELMHSEARLEVEFLTKGEPFLVNIKSNDVNVNQELALCSGFDLGQMETLVDNLRGKGSICDKEQSDRHVVDLAHSSIQEQTNDNVECVDRLSITSTTDLSHDNTSIVGGEVGEVSIDNSSKVEEMQDGRAEQIPVITLETESIISDKQAHTSIQKNTNDLIEFVERLLITSTTVLPHENTSSIDGEVGKGSLDNFSKGEEIQDASNEPIQNAREEQIPVITLETESIICDEQAHTTMQENTNDLIEFVDRLSITSTTDLSHEKTSNSGGEVGEGSLDSSSQFKDAGEEQIPVTTLETGSIICDEQAHTMIQETQELQIIYDSREAFPIITIDDGEAFPIITIDDSDGDQDIAVGVSVENTTFSASDGDYIVSLDTYANEHALELNQGGISHGFARATLQDFPEFSNLVPGTRLYVFSDCDKHNHIVNVVSS